MQQQPTTPHGRGGSPSRRCRSRRRRGSPGGGVVSAASVALVAALLALGLGACGSDSGAGGSALGAGSRRRSSGPDATAAPVAATGRDDLCTLLEAAEIEAQFGGPVTATIVDDIMCRWRIGTGEIVADATGDLLIGFSGARPGMPIEADFDEMVANLFPDSVAVDGVGDDAVLDGDSDYAPRTLTFRSDDSIVTVEARFFPPLPGTQEKLTALAQLLVGRL